MAEGKGKAEALRLEAQVKADEIRLRGLAEADAMLKKAQAWERYNEAAMLENFIKVLPELARAVSEPLSKVDKIVVIGGDKGLGTNQITGQVTQILAQMPEVVKALTGADLAKFLRDKLGTTVEAKAEPQEKKSEKK